MARGDHIYVARAGGLYSHHGIDCGDGSVIHLFGDRPSDSRVTRTEASLFGQGGKIRIRDYPNRPVNVAWDPRVELSHLMDRVQGRALPLQTDGSADAVMARAESRLGERGWDPVFNNCEHFASWCKTGVSRSCQLEMLWWPLAAYQTAIEL